LLPISKNLIFADAHSGHFFYSLPIRQGVTLPFCCCTFGADLEEDLKSKQEKKQNINKE
jgi:hypothetical protein